MGGRVLVVDDDETVAGVVVDYLCRAGYDTAHVVDGPSALAIAVPDDGSPGPDLVVLDLMIPGIDGIEVCRRMREREPSCPGVMLDRARRGGAPRTRARGRRRRLRDQALQPARARAPRRLRPAPSTLAPGPSPLARVASGPIELDVQGRRAFRLGVELALTVREFDLLAYLLTHPDRAFSRDELLQQVWGWSFGDQSTVTVHIRRLREKVEVDPRHPRLIVTVWGVGYRWSAAAAPDGAEPEVTGLAADGQPA